MKNDRLTVWRQAHAQAALTSLGDLCRNPLGSFLAWLIIAIALVLPGILALILVNLQQLNHNWKGNVPTISAYLQPHVSLVQQDKMLRQISNWPEVEHVRQITPDQALQQVQSVTQLTDLPDVLPQNPLPPVLVVRPQSSHVAKATLEQLKNRLAQTPGVDFVQLDLSWVEKWLAILEMGKRLVFSVAFLLGVGVLLIVGNTVRLSLLKHKRDINILSLIGATASFIRRPFLYRGFWLGLGGGLLAVAILSFLQHRLGAAVYRIAKLYNSPFQLQGMTVTTAIILLVAVGILGILGALVACWRVRPSADINN